MSSKNLAPDTSNFEHTTNHNTNFQRHPIYSRFDGHGRTLESCHKGCKGIYGNENARAPSLSSHSSDQTWTFWQIIPHAGFQNNLNPSPGWGFKKSTSTTRSWSFVSFWSTSSSFLWVVQAFGYPWYYSEVICIEALSDHARFPANGKCHSGWNDLNQCEVKQPLPTSPLQLHIPNETTEVAILQVAVPKSFVESLDSNILLSDGEHPDWWRKSIWHGRRGRSLPSELSWMYQKEMWMGHIAQGIGANYLEFAGGSSQDLESYSTSGSLNRKPDLPGLGHKVGSFKRNAHQNIFEWSYPSDSINPEKLSDEGIRNTLTSDIWMPWCCVY